METSNFVPGVVQVTVLPSPMAQVMLVVLADTVTEIPPSAAVANGGRRRCCRPAAGATGAAGVPQRPGVSEGQSAAAGGPVSG